MVSFCVLSLLMNGQRQMKSRLKLSQIALIWLRFGCGVSKRMTQTTPGDDQTSHQLPPNLQSSIINPLSSTCLNRYSYLIIMGFRSFSSVERDNANPSCALPPRTENFKTYELRVNFSPIIWCYLITIMNLCGTNQRKRAT